MSKYIDEFITIINEDQNNDTSSKKLEKRRRIEDLQEKKRLELELDEYQIL